MLSPRRRRHDLSPSGSSAAASPARPPHQDEALCRCPGSGPVGESRLQQPHGDEALEGERRSLRFLADAVAVVAVALLLLLLPRRRGRRAGDRHLERLHRPQDRGAEEDQHRGLLRGGGSGRGSGIRREKEGGASEERGGSGPECLDQRSRLGQTAANKVVAALNLLLLLLLQRFGLVFALQGQGQRAKRRGGLPAGVQ